MCIGKRRCQQKRNLKGRSQKESRTITYEEEAKIVTLLRSHESSRGKNYYRDVADLVEVMADTGLRQMETLELLYRDVNFTDNMILVRQSKSSPRRVPMTNRVATILQRRQEANQDKPFNLNEMHIRMAWRWVKEVLELPEPQRLVLHSLRKTCARRLIDSGVYIEIIYEWLGHPIVHKLHRKAPLPLKKLTEAAKILEAYNHLDLQ